MVVAFVVEDGSSAIATIAIMEMIKKTKEMRIAMPLIAKNGRYIVGFRFHCASRMNTHPMALMVNVATTL